MTANGGNLDPNTVYVQNINYQTTEEGLKQAFEQFGQVNSCRILKDRMYGQLFSRGTGFVEFAQPDSVQKAVNDKNITVDGRVLSVNQAYKKYERKNDTLFVSGIPAGTTKEDILASLNQYNPVDANIVFEDKENRRGFAFVKFSSTGDRDKVIQEHQTIQLKGQESSIKAAVRDFDEPTKK